MSTPRVKAGMWVSMALRMGNADGRYGAVIRKGDPCYDEYRECVDRVSQRGYARFPG